MKYLLNAFAPALLMVTTVLADDLTYGPPLSPVSWKVVKTTRPFDASGFSFGQSIMGDAFEPPTSVQMVELSDGRPFGEKNPRAVWLARFESVLVHRLDTEDFTSVTLSLAFDADTNNLLCAFTEPSPQWSVSTLDPMNIESEAAKAGWEITPAHYGELKSTLTDVLGAAWKRFDADPSKAGQVIVRPRFTADKFPAHEVDGVLVPDRPPSNVWIVEVLGTVIMQRYLQGEDRQLTTLVARFRDGDLMGLPSMILP